MAPGLPSRAVRHQEIEMLCLHLFDFICLFYVKTVHFRKSKGFLLQDKCTTFYYLS